MRAVVQRVERASVTVEGRTAGEMGRGLVVLLGIGSADGEADVQWMAQKVVGLRIFSDEAGRMNRSVLDVAGSVLAVSQFTLYGDVQKGKRPSFTGAMEPVAAESLYRKFGDACRAAGVAVQEGVFRAHMLVTLANDGPVTILLESPTKAAS
jgi:D-tyrosyl-tRNA(Tyr) deacylase